MGISRRTPIGWPLCVLGARLPPGTSGPPALYPRCRSTFRPASALETPNVEARGCARGRRTSPAGGWSRRYRATGGRATDVSENARFDHQVRELQFRERQHTAERPRRSIRRPVRSHPEAMVIALLGRDGVVIADEHRWFANVTQLLRHNAGP